jgi:hypothetical protein
MPIQVRGVLVHATSGTELSRVRTEFRLRLPEPINKSPLESRGPTLSCNQVATSTHFEDGQVDIGYFADVESGKCSSRPWRWAYSSTGEAPVAPYLCALVRAGLACAQNLYVTRTGRLGTFQHAATHL